MRVISGKHKGRNIKAVPGMKTRPTADNVKESLFNRIGPYFNKGAVLDLYAGTGNLGIEALSRGMTTCVFVDQSPQAIRVIKNNITSLNLRDCSEVYRNDAIRALHVLAKRNKKFDLIFLDPPYANEQLEKVVNIIADKQLLVTEGQIVCEHRSGLTLPDNINILHVSLTVTYGDTSITIYSY